MKASKTNENRPPYLLRDRRVTTKSKHPGNAQAATTVSEGPAGLTLFAEPPDVSGDEVSTVSSTVAVELGASNTVSFEKLHVTDAGSDAQPRPSWSANPAVEANVI